MGVELKEVGERNEIFGVNLSPKIWSLAKIISVSSISEDFKVTSESISAHPVKTKLQICDENGNVLNI